MWILTYEMRYSEDKKTTSIQLYRLNTLDGRVIEDVKIHKKDEVKTMSYLIRRSLDIGIPLLTAVSKKKGTPLWTETQNTS